MHTRKWPGLCFKVGFILASLSLAFSTVVWKIWLTCGHICHALLDFNQTWVIYATWNDTYVHKVKGHTKVKDYHSEVKLSYRLKM